jgi:hypothetical protein
MTSNTKFPTYKDHLNKTFLEELAYKIWSTKSARFNASERLSTISEWSNLSLAFLSSYLIIVSLLTTYHLVTNETVSSILGFATTGLSILFLVISQIENAKDYNLRSFKFHQCAMQLSSLHNEVRIFKTILTHTDEEKEHFCKNVQERYFTILNNYENHDPIDHDQFKLQFATYFELKRKDKYRTSLKAYYKSKFIYHLYIIFPVLLMIVYFLVKNIIKH